MGRLARACRGAAWLPVAALLISCGGGDSSEDRSGPPSAQLSGDAASGSAKRMRIAEFVPPNPIPPAANVDGMWSPVYPWPLISVHSVLLPDGRVMTYGSDLNGLQTGHAKYDIWDSTGAPDAGHLTLDNATGTDIFCSSQVLLPQSGNLFIAGGDVWTGTQTTNGPNNNSNLYDSASTSLTRGINMNRARWYSTFDHADQRRDLHPGRLRRQRPPRNPRPRRFVPPDERDQHQRDRNLVPAQLRRARRPGLRLRPRQRSDVPGRHDRQRHDHDARQFQHRVQRRLVLERRDVPARPNPADRRHLERRLHDRHYRHQPGRRADADDVEHARLGQRDGARRRQGPRDQRQRRAGRSDRLQQHRGDLGPRHRAVAPGRGRAKDAPVPLERVAAARRQRSRQRRRCHVADAHHRPEQEQPERRDLLPAVPVHQHQPRHQRARRAADRRQRADVDRHRQDLRPGCRRRGEREPRHAGQDRLDDAQLQHGPALPRPDVQRERVARRRAGADARRRCAARVLPAVRVQRSRRAVGRQDRPHGHRERPEPRHRPGAHEPGRTDQHRRCPRRPRAERQRPERRRAELRRDRPAAGPGDRCEQWPHHRHPDDRGQLQRRRLGDRRHQQRDRRVRLDDAGGDAADPRKPAGAGLRRHQRRRELQRERERRQRPAVQVELRRRHPGYRLVDLARPPRTRTRARAPSSSPSTSRTTAVRSAAAASSRPCTCRPRRSRRPRRATCWSRTRPARIRGCGS